jgi:hypothetical protein
MDCGSGYRSLVAGHPSYLLSVFCRFSVEFLRIKMGFWIFSYKEFHYTGGAWKGAAMMLSCPIVMNIFLLHPLLFIEYTLNPCIWEGALVPSFLYNFSFEQVLRPHGKYSSYFSLILKLPALDRLRNIFWRFTTRPQKFLSTNTAKEEVYWFLIRQVLKKNLRD